MIEQRGDDVLIRIKAGPGASRDAIAGTVGDRLKVRVSAPAEGGRANTAIRRLLAERLGVRVNQVEIESGTSHPEKLVRVTRASADDVRRRL